MNVKLEGTSELIGLNNNHSLCFAFKHIHLSLNIKSINHPFFIIFILSVLCERVSLFIDSEFHWHNAKITIYIFITAHNREEFFQCSIV